MRKPTQPGSCATCNTEIFTWHDSPGGGRRMLANGEYRDVAFRVKSEVPAYNGSMMRVGFCSECANGLDASKFQEITDNVSDGTKLDALRMSFKDESARLLFLGSMLSRKVEDFWEGKKVSRRVCQHCFRVYEDGEDHASQCEVIKKDLA